MREAIDSALSQTYRNVEVIVVNDGSNDDGATLEVAGSYGSRISLIDKPNGGVATALNAGIAAMSGEYFSWLSHDDVYPPDKIERQIALLARQENKAAIVFGDFTIIDEEGNRTTTVSTSRIDTSNMVFELYAYQGVHGCSLLVPKHAFEVCGVFREDLPTTQDYDLWLRMAQKFPFVRADGTLTFGRQHSEQGSRTLGHKDEALDFFISNLELLSTDYMNAAYTESQIIEKYGILLRKFSAPSLWPVFYRVLNQSWKQLSFKNFLRAVFFFCFQ